MVLQDKEVSMNLALSSDAKPRLKWTPELHQRFVRAVDQLGGTEKATPKSLTRIMGIHGLTLYHLKSHLQKYRLGRSQQTRPRNRTKLRDDGESRRSKFTDKICVEEAHEEINENLETARALQVQMEVQKKLHEQIEVQRHLQIRIEAQGKYLQTVLRKAQETLSGYISCSIEVENARDQLAELASMVDSACPSSSFSVPTSESDGSILKGVRNKLLGRNSLESSLTSSESSGRDEETPLKHEVHAESNKGKIIFVENNKLEENQVNNRKRSRMTFDGVNESSDEQAERLRSLGGIDLNCDMLNGIDTGPAGGIDLNFVGVELLDETSGVEQHYQ